MVRKLKHHEQKLLRKVDFLDWKQDQGHRDAQVMRTYHLQDREDYTKYNKICGQVKHLSHELAQLEPDDPIRLKYQELLLDKLYQMGLINSTSKMSEIENKLSVSSICRRRLPVVMTRLKMSETISGAVKLIEQGHVRVGHQVITDPAFLVTRNMEDFVTWTDQSKIKRNILRYRNEVDDFDLL